MLFCANRPILFVLLTGLLVAVGCSSQTAEEPLVEQPVAEKPGPETSDPDSALEEKWGEHTQGLPFVLGYQKGLELAQTEGKPAMMFVTTTWCGWCKTLAEENFNDPDVRDLLKGFVCVIVDGDVEKDAEVQLGAGEGYPHIVFVSAEGKNIGECLGYKPVSEFKPIVEQALAQAGPG